MPWDIPDVVLQDTEKHHDYSMCPISGFAARWLCGDQNMTPARDKAREWFTRARNLGASCRSLYAFCIGADYHAKGFFQPNQVTLSDLQCEGYLNGKVDEVVDSAENWTVRAKCYYEYWEPRAGQKMKVSESPVFVVNNNRINTIVGSLTAEAEMLVEYQGGVQVLDDAVGITSTTTSTTSSTTTLAQTTTTTKPQSTTTMPETTTTVAMSSTTSVIARAVSYENKTLGEAASKPKMENTYVIAGILVLVALVLLSVVIAFLYSVADRKTDSPEKVSDIEASKPRKKRKELTLRDIKGLGKVAEDRLRSHGIDSLQKLLEADAVDVCCETGISEERITNWKRKAEELLAGRDF
jgi:hypothetical protein